MRIRSGRAPRIRGAFLRECSRGFPRLLFRTAPLPRRHTVARIASAGGLGRVRGMPGGLRPEPAQGTAPARRLAPAGRPVPSRRPGQPPLPWPRWPPAWQRKARVPRAGETEPRELPGKARAKPGKLRRAALCRAVLRRSAPGLVVLRWAAPRLASLRRDFWIREATPCYALLRLAVPNYALLCFAVRWCFARSCGAMQCHTLLGQALSGDTSSCHLMQCHTML